MALIKAKLLVNPSFITARLHLPKLDYQTADDSFDSQVSQNEFSILAHAKTTLSVIRTMKDVYPDVEIRHLVPLKPERVLLHEMIAVLQCFIQQENDPGQCDSVFESMATKAIASLKQDLNYERTLSTMDHEYEDLKQQVYLFMIGSEANLSASEATHTEKLITEAKMRLGKNMSEEQIYNACFNRVLTELYMSRARNHASSYVHNVLPEVMSEHQWSSLTLLPIDQSTAVFTAGGVASGKTSSLRIVCEIIARTPGVPWEDMSHHNTDRLRVALLDPTNDPKTFSCKTGDEARLLKERELLLLQSRFLQTGEVPHEVHDTPAIKAKDFADSARSRKHTLACVVSTEAEDALNRAYHRGVKENRYCPAEEILKSHKDAAKSLVSALNQEGIKGTNTTVLMYDNNLAGQTPTLFAVIDVKLGVITVSNNEMMKNWIKKCDMKTTLTGYDPSVDTYECELYPATTQSAESYFAPLITRGYQLKYDVAFSQSSQPGQLQAESTHLRRT